MVDFSTIPDAMQPAIVARRQRFIDGQYPAFVPTSLPVTRSQCPELGPILRPTQLKAFGFDINQCGCVGSIRACGLFDFATTAEVRPGIQCCETCPEHPEAKEPPC